MNEQIVYHVFESGRDWYSTDRAIATAIRRYLKRIGAISIRMYQQIWDNDDCTEDCLYSYGALPY